MQPRRPTQARLIVAASGTTSPGRREQQAIPFMSARRIRMNIRAVLDDKDAWLTPAYSLAIQAEHLLQVIEGRREVVADAKPRRERARSANRISWTPEMRAALLADTRSTQEIAAEMNTTVGNISMQRSISRKMLAAAA